MCAHTYLYCATVKNCVPKFHSINILLHYLIPEMYHAPQEADFGNYCKAMVEKFVPQKERTWLATIFKVTDSSGVCAWGLE